jgi:hypothetical protein
MNTGLTHQHMCSLWLEGKKVVSRRMGCGSCRALVVWFGFNSVDNVGELDRILDEKYWNIVSD